MIKRYLPGMCADNRVYYLFVFFGVWFLERYVLASGRRPAQHVLCLWKPKNCKGVIIFTAKSRSELMFEWPCELNETPPLQNELINSHTSSCRVVFGILNAQVTKCWSRVTCKLNIYSTLYTTGRVAVSPPSMLFYFIFITDTGPKGAITI